MTKRTSYQDASLAWEKVKDNLRDRSMYQDGSLDEGLAREIDEEQIEAIRANTWRI